MRVTDWQDADDAMPWVQAYAEPMGVPEDVIAQIASLDPVRAIGDDRLIRFAYEVDGAIRATTEMLITDGIAGIYLVATQEPYRYRGAATALVAAALDRARDEGLSTATLQADASVEGLYRPLGFETVSEIQVFGPPSA